MPALFEPADRVPAELTGKTPVEVAQYYQERERNIVATAQTAIANAGANGNERQPAPNAEAFETDPAGATRTLISQESVSRTEWNQMTEAVRNNLMQSAKRTASEGKTYWQRLLPQIEQVIAGVEPLSKLDPQMWETVYNTVLGQNYGTIQTEERAAEAARQTASHEGVSDASTPPPVPRVLSAKEMSICEGLGITADQFRLGEERMKSNVFPVTIDNRRR